MSAEIDWRVAFEYIKPNVRSTSKNTAVPLVYSVNTLPSRFSYFAVPVLHFLFCFYWSAPHPLLLLWPHSLPVRRDKLADSLQKVPAEKFYPAKSAGRVLNISMLR